MVFVRRLVWNERNIAHIARHEVTVEEVCHGAFVALESYEGRFLLIGPTAAGRMLGVVLEPLEEGVYFSVTARPASRKERRYYQEQTQGGETV